MFQILLPDPLAEVTIETVQEVRKEFKEKNRKTETQVTKAKELLETYTENTYDNCY
jgi:hypothetical protein